MEKKCKDCGIVKITEEFYTVKRNGGVFFQARCKVCARKKDAENRKSKIKKRPQLYARIFKKYRQNNQEKKRAHDTIKQSLKRGKINRPEYCSKCGKKCFVCAHHHDYNKRLDVIWLCPLCHKKIHKEVKGAFLV